MQKEFFSCELQKDLIYRKIDEMMSEWSVAVSGGQVLFCNDQFCRLLKMPEDRIIGRPLEDFSANRNALSSFLLKASTTRADQRLVFRSSDGKAVSVQAAAATIETDSGKITCVVGSDLTESEKMSDVIRQLVLQESSLQHAFERVTAIEEELRAQNDRLVLTHIELERERARYQELFETVPDGYIVTDPEGAIQEYNRAAAELLGCTSGKVIGKNISSFLRSEAIRILPSSNPDAPRLSRWEGEVHSLNRQPFWAEVSVATSYDQNGGVTGLRWLIRDATERRRAEQQLKELNESLERRVAERTAEVEQRSNQIRQLAADLSLSEQRERQRLSLILHDGLQQILVGAKYRLAFVGRDSDVYTATRHAMQLIDDAIETSRSLTAELSPPILLQGDLLSALEWLVRWMRAKHDLEVKLTVTEKIQSLSEGVLLMLFQAARELLFNVVKHAGVRSARIHVQRLNEFVVMQIEDDGSGFDPDQLPSRGGQSGGLGLFGIKERFSYIGGQVEISSAPGLGTRFKLTVPITAPESKSEVVLPWKEKKAVSPGPQLELRPASAVNRIRIMLVDDHKVMRQGLATLLRGEPDFEIVAEASDGEAAVRLAREVWPDIILMDINMPGIDGIQATKIIHKELPETRIIGFSMYRESEQEQAIRAAGAVDYLTKSGPSEAVLQVIRAQAPKRDFSALTAH